MTTWDFLTTSAVYTFKIQVPGTSSSDDEPECGFLVEITGASCVNQFDVQLIVDKDKYPEGLNYNDTTADKIHLVLDIKVGSDDPWINCVFSWLGRPVLQEDGSIKMGNGPVCEAGDMDMQATARLIAYCSAGEAH